MSATIVAVLNNTSAGPGCSIGRFPAQHATVLAGVLKHMLNGNRIDSLAAIKSANTTRLASVIHRLGSEYGWQIDREDVAINTVDGRVAYVRVYWLSLEAIAQAYKSGAGEFIQKVEQARLDARLQASTTNGQPNMNPGSKTPAEGQGHE